mgnify:CR=1 FL=1
MLGWLVSLLVSAPLAADRLVLHSGEVYVGTILSQDHNSVTIRTAFAPITVSKRNLREIVYDRIERDWSVPLGALWRSSLVPGWGQFWTERPVMGCVYGGLFVAGIAGSLLTWNRYDDARSFYLSHVHTDERYRDVQDKKDSFNLMLAGTIAVWAWQTLDAFLWAPVGERRVVVAAVPHSEGSTLFVSCRF